MLQIQSPDDMSKYISQIRELQREVRRTRDLAGRATMLAGLGLILSIAILTVTLSGLDGLRDGLQVLSTASPQDYGDVARGLAEDTAISVDEAARLAGN